MPGRSIFRFLALAAFIVAVAVGLWLAEVRGPLVVLGVALAWAIASLYEWVTWRESESRWPTAFDRPPPARRSSPPAPARAATPVRPAPQRSSWLGELRSWSAARSARPAPPIVQQPEPPSEPEPEPVPGPEAEPVFEPEAVLKPERPPAPEPERPPAPELERDPYVEPEPEPEPVPARVSEVEPPQAPETKPDPKPAPEPEPVREHERKPEPVTASGSDPDPAPAAGPQPAPVAQRPSRFRDFLRRPAAVRTEAPSTRPGRESDPRRPAAPPVRARAVPAPPAPAQRPVARLSERRRAPQQWNLWDLERVARAESERTPDQVNEWAHLFIHLRKFAEPGGTLPTEFDGLVRESFGPLLERLER